MANDMEPRRARVTKVPRIPRSVTCLWRTKPHRGSGQGHDEVTWPWSRIVDPGHGVAGHVWWNRQRVPNRDWLDAVQRGV